MQVPHSLRKFKLKVSDIGNLLKLLIPPFYLDRQKVNIFHGLFAYFLTYYVLYVSLVISFVIYITIVLYVSLEVICDLKLTICYILFTVPPLYRSLFSQLSFSSVCSCISLVISSRLIMADSETIDVVSLDTPNNDAQNSSPTAVELEVDTQESTKTARIKWNDSEAASLIEEWSTPNIQSKFKDKKTSNKKCWELVADLLNKSDSVQRKVTGKQCSDKMKTLRTRYEPLAKALSRSGSENKRNQIEHDFPLFRLLDMVLGSSPLIQPGVLVESNIDVPSAETTDKSCTPVPPTPSSSAPSPNTPSDPNTDTTPKTPTTKNLWAANKHKARLRIARKRDQSAEILTEMRTQGDLFKSFVNSYKEEKEDNKKTQKLLVESVQERSGAIRDLTRVITATLVSNSQQVQANHGFHPYHSQQTQQTQNTLVNRHSLSAMMANPNLTGYDDTNTTTDPQHPSHGQYHGHGSGY